MWKVWPAPAQDMRVLSRQHYSGYPGPGGREFGELELESSADLLAEFIDAPVGDAVDGAVPILAPRQDAGLQEHAEVLGRVLLAGVQLFC